MVVGFGESKFVRFWCNTNFILDKKDSVYETKPV